jgi:hypothetical protein
VDDPTRRCVPRRFRVALWPIGLLDRTNTQPYIPTGHRLVRLWLWPGVAATLPSGTTALRGRVVRAGEPARWTRLTAFDPGGQVVGRAHGDDRGEFLLVVTDQAANPLPPSLPLTLRVEARRQLAPVDSRDRCADLVIERVARSPVPPAPPVLDSPVLRGTARPAGYVANARPDTPVVVPVGTELTLPDDIAFATP